MAACIATLATPVQAFYQYDIVRSIPIFIEVPIHAVSLYAFWMAMAAHGAVSVAETLAEKLDNYEVGIYHFNRSASATITWPDGDYETRDIDTDQYFDYDPFTKVRRWFEKDTFSVIHRDGTRTDTITYSQTAPSVIEYNQEDVHYKRNVMAGCHCSDFSWDSYQTITGYLIRRGSGAWGRPVTGWFKGWDCTPLWKNDTLYHTPVSPWEDNHHCFIGPSSLGTSSMALFKLKRQKFTPGIAEILNDGTVTLWFSPDGTGF